MIQGLSVRGSDFQEASLSEDQGGGPWLDNHVPFWSG